MNFDPAGLVTRYDNEGISLQQYLSRELTTLAHTPTLGDVLEQITRRSGGKVGFDTAVRDLAEERRRFRARRFRAAMSSRSCTTRTLRDLF